MYTLLQWLVAISKWWFIHDNTTDNSINSTLPFKDFSLIIVSRNIWFVLNITVVYKYASTVFNTVLYL